VSSAVSFSPNCSPSLLSYHTYSPLTQSHTIISCDQFASIIIMEQETIIWPVPLDIVRALFVLQLMFPV
jgi:hypothetical protein